MSHSLLFRASTITALGWRWIKLPRQTSAAPAYSPTTVLRESMSSPTPPFTLLHGEELSTSAITLVSGSMWTGQWQLVSGVQPSTTISSHPVAPLLRTVSASTGTAEPKPGWSDFLDPPRSRQTRAGEF